jgi:ribosomal protein S18 acetylase RimI-like enzyme
LFGCATLDPWLTSVMERDALRVTLPKEGVPGASFDDLLPKPGRSTFLYARVPVPETKTVQELIDDGFRVVDVSVLLERAGHAVRSVQPVNSILIRDAAPADAASVCAIASRCFRFSRFHLDPALTAELANHIKHEWAANFFRGQRGDRMLVAEHRGQIVGFLSVLMPPPSTIWTIDLIGVDIPDQGRGIGHALVQRLAALGNETDVRLRVGTQIANAPSLRLYERCGFLIQESFYVLHKHQRRPS